MAKRGVVESIKTILKDVTCFPAIELDMQLEDMKLDEIDMRQIITDIQDEFDIAVTEGDEQFWFSVSDIIEYVYAK